MFRSYFVVISMLLLDVSTSNEERYITTLNYSKILVKPVIVRGRRAHHGLMPYVVSFKTAAKFSVNNITWRNICAGSIISPLEVLTAAHCFEVDDFFYVKYQNLIRVVAGHLATLITETKNKDVPESCTQWRHISKINIHKDYHFPINDIALVVVDKPWIFDDDVNFIEIATKTEDDLKNCIVAGSGLDPRAGTEASPMLLIGDVKVISRKDCSMQWEINMDSFICSNSIFNETKGLAKGFSGGPLVCENMLLGSFIPSGDRLDGIACGKNIDGTTLFTRVSEYLDFIKKSYKARKMKLSSFVNTGRWIKCVCSWYVLFVGQYILGKTVSN